MDLNVTTATEDALIKFCIQRGERDALVAGIHGAIVVKVTDHIVVKWGWTVTAAEAAMHDFAYKNLNHDIVRVPQVYRFIQDESGRGYLFMEYIYGQTLANIDINLHKEIIFRVAEIVEHLGQIQAPEQKPGPIGDTVALGDICGATMA
jgi:hypothetical protein